MFEVAFRAREEVIQKHCCKHDLTRKDEEMASTIFFSWQADTSTLTGRNFIESTLQKSLNEIAAKPELHPADRELQIDRDTKGVPGQPPILETIFRKIDSATVFVPDFTFVGGRSDARLMPNPNVLIEYGWALKSLGHARIVGVMNTAYGIPTTENMPFDLAHQRFPIAYCLAEGADESTRKAERDRLARILGKAILEVLESDEYKESLPNTPAPLPFRATDPSEGYSRFRRSSEAIGKKLNMFSIVATEDVYLRPGPSLWLRVMPSADPGMRLSQPALLRTLQEGLLLTPLNILSSCNFLRAPDGVGMYEVESSSKDETGAVAFAFFTGEVWSIDTYSLKPFPERSTLPAFEGPLTSALRRYSAFLSKHGIQPPLRWIAGMDGVAGRDLYLMPPPGRSFIDPGPQGNCLLDVITEEGQYVPPITPGEALMPFFKKVYDACGVPRPDYYPTPE
jgi:hypothetical protein